MFSKSLSRAVLVMVAVAAMLLLPSCSASGNRFYSSSDPTSIVARPSASSFSSVAAPVIEEPEPELEIAHHSGYGDTGHNQLYGIVEDGRDDMRGISPIGSWASDYGMNAWSIGIELVHSGDAPYPEAQLDALDDLIAYIDEYYGFESTIIDHKAWRLGNSDTSAEFQKHLSRHQTLRSHD